jgi:hypothetical protein
VAAKSALAWAIIVLNTSYLLELFAVPGHSTEHGKPAVRARFADATDRGDMLFVPAPCLFELGNHIANVSTGSLRKTLAEALLEAVERSLEGGGPWVIIPAVPREVLPELCRLFKGEFVSQGIGITDTSVIYEARRLKKNYRETSRVHIWTKDRRLKSYEPDKERDPYVG